MNIEAFLNSCPDGLAIVSGDFNPLSTRIKSADVTMATGLKQIVKFPTRNDAILDWCFPNKPNLLSNPVQLPKIGTSDHNVFMISPASNIHPSNKMRPKRILVRDIRRSRLREFGAWVTSMDWSIIKQIPSVQEKVDLLYSCLTFAVNLFLPLRKVKVSSTDKPWILAGLKLLIAKRQKALVIHGKSSQVYKALRNRVQRECSMCKKRFYNNKVSSLQQCNSALWWKDIKELGDLTHSGDWISHLISGEITDDASLAQTFNDFLGAISSLYNICLL